MPADAIELRPAVLLGAKLRKPLGPVEDDRRHVAERFDVVDRGRALVEPFDRGKRRLEPRLRALPFERFDERRLLARLVRAGAAVDVDVAVEPAAEDVAAEKARPVRLLDLGLEDFLDVIELAADVD